MNLKELIDLEILLNKPRDKEARRAFALKHKTNKIEQLLAWIKKGNIDDGLNFENSIKRVLITVYFISLILGFVTGLGLLTFSVNEHVNIVYILIFTAFIPLLFGFINLFYIFFKPSVSILPATILQKIVNYFVNKDKKIEVGSTVLYYLNIKTAALASVFFSLGLVLSLLLVGMGRDLPFGWSTTLLIDSEEFYKIIKLIAMPFAFLLDKFPTIEIIENSRYFSSQARVIDSKDMIYIHNLWWRFLLLSALFYGVFFRVVIYILAKLKYKYAIKKEIFSLNGIEELLDDFNTPLIKTHNNSSTKYVNKSVNSSVNIIENIVKLDALLGWAIDKNRLLLITDKYALEVDYLASVGGLEPIEYDLQVINNLVNKEVGIVVNSYEVPTLDFLDFLEELSNKANRVYIIFENGKQKDIDIWSAKVATLKRDNIYLKVYNDT